MWQKILDFIRKYFFNIEINPQPTPGPSPGPTPEPTPVDPPAPNMDVYDNVVIKEGDLEMGLGYKPDPPDPNDFLWDEYAKIMPLEYMPKVADHSQYHGPVVSQGATGSCVGQSVRAAFEYLARAFWGMSAWRGSSLFCYYNARRLEGGAILDNGTYIRLGVKGGAEWGCATMGAWPFDASKVNQKPPDKAYGEGAQLELRDYLRCENELEVKSALAQGYPVVVGFDVYETTYNTKARTTGWIDRPTSSMRQRGGHAICLVGFDDYRGAFKFKNSWGDDWGEKGYGWLPYGYGIRDCWAIRPKIEVDPTP